MVQGSYLKGVAYEHGYQLKQSLSVHASIIVVVNLFACLHFHYSIPLLVDQNFFNFHTVATCTKFTMYCKFLIILDWTKHLILFNTIHHLFTHGIYTIQMQLKNTFSCKELFFYMLIWIQTVIKLARARICFMLVRHSLNVFAFLYLAELKNWMQDGSHNNLVSHYPWLNQLFNSIQYHSSCLLMGLLTI